jgi:hypothetical protein
MVSGWLHQENLVGAMVTGLKRVSPQEGIRSAWRAVAGLLLVAVLGFWWLQWQDAPTGAMASERGVPTAKHHARGHNRHD